MIRPQRKLIRTFRIFCEGDTEFNYFNALRKLTESVKIIPVNMEGGGYREYLKKLKKDSPQNRVATFVVIDCDRARNMAEEKEALIKLINHCKRQNEKSSSPYILILNNPDFEYIACLHDSSYKGGNTKQHIIKIFGFDGVGEFKSNATIYDFLNKDSKSYLTMLQKIERNDKKFIKNKFQFDIQKIIISVETSIDWDELHNNNSNIDELFKLISLE